MKTVLVISLVFLQVISLAQIEDEFDNEHVIDSAKFIEIINYTLDKYERISSLSYSNSNYYSLLKEEKKYSLVFYNDSPIFKSPDKESTIIDTLNLGEAVYIPELWLPPGYYKTIRVIDKTIGNEISHPNYYLCVTKDNLIGFIHSYNLVYDIKPQSNGLLLYKGGGKSALVSKDHKQSKYFQSGKINKSKTSNKYVYNEYHRYPQIKESAIYLFNSDTWNEKYLTLGNDPVFFNDSIVVYLRSSDTNSYNKILCTFNLQSSEINDILIPPKGHTFISRGVDYAYLSKIEISNEKEIVIKVYSEHDYYEFEQAQVYKYYLKINGEIIEKKQIQ